MHEQYISHTFVCDAKACKNKVTMSGYIEDVVKVLEEKGWNIDVPILETENHDFCPSCSEEVRNFLFND